MDKANFLIICGNCLKTSEIKQGMFKDTSPDMVGPTEIEADYSGDGAWCVGIWSIKCECGNKLGDC